MTVDTRPHDLAGCRARHGTTSAAAGRPCYPDCGCRCHRDPVDIAAEAEPWQAEILVEWWPSASIGEATAVRHLLEGWCGTLMERLQQLGVTDPTVELSIDGAPGVSSVAEAPPREPEQKWGHNPECFEGQGCLKLEHGDPVYPEELCPCPDPPGFLDPLCPVHGPLKPEGPQPRVLSEEEEAHVRWAADWLEHGMPLGVRPHLVGLLQIIDRMCPQGAVRLDEAPQAKAGAGEPRTGVTLWPDELDGGWVAECHLIPGCLSQGDTPQEALENVLDVALTLARMATDAGNRTPLTDVLAELGVEATEDDDAAG